MKKIIFVFLLTVPFCKAADYQKEAQSAASMGKWQNLYKLIDEKNVDVNKIHHSDQTSFIHYAVAHNDFEAVQELLNRGANPNPALHALIARYRVFKTPEIPRIRFLLEKGADPYALDYDLSPPQSPFDSVLNLKITDSPQQVKQKQELIDLFEQYDPRKNIKPAKKQ